MGCTPEFDAKLNGERETHKIEGERETDKELLRPSLLDDALLSRPHLTPLSLSVYAAARQTDRLLPPLLTPVTDAVSDPLILPATLLVLIKRLAKQTLTPIGPTPPPPSASKENKKGKSKKASHSAVKRKFELKI